MNRYESNAIRWWLNKRLVELAEDTPGQSVGVLRRNGQIRYVRWLGFIEAGTAKQMTGARPVKLAVAYVGKRHAPAAEWRELEDGEYVHGCLTADGAYGIVDTQVRIVAGRTKQHG